MERITLESPEDALIVAVRDLMQGRRVIVATAGNHHAGYLHGQALQLPDIELLGDQLRTSRAAGRTALEYTSPLGVPGVVHFVGCYSPDNLRGRSADTLILVSLRHDPELLAEHAHAVLATANGPRLLVVPADVDR